MLPRRLTVGRSPRTASRRGSMGPKCLLAGSSTAPPGFGRPSGQTSPPDVRRRRRKGIAADFELELSTRGTVGTADRRYAEEKIIRVGKLSPRPVIFGRIILREEPNPAVERRSVVEATLDVSGRIIRTQVAAPRMREAIDLLEDRLRRQLDEFSEHLESRRQETGVAEPGSWRRGDLPTPRPDFFPRPVDERELVAHKTLAVGAQTPDEAAFDMRLLDFDFYLFKNIATGADNVLYELPDDRVGWAQATPEADSADRYAAPLTADPAPPATMPVDQAVQRLDAGGEPFVFFLDATTGRGNVLYRRYDGHYGLITPADTEKGAAGPAPP